jgi:hypothetical protein
MRTQGWLSLVDARFDNALEEAVKSRVPIRLSMVPASLVNLGRFLFVFLLSVLQGALLEVATHTERSADGKLGEQSMQR